jgi:hypothetical protein
MARKGTPAKTRVNPTTKRVLPSSRMAMTSSIGIEALEKNLI